MKKLCLMSECLHDDLDRTILKSSFSSFHFPQDDTVVSCTAAQWICAADPLCSTALEYYNRFCGSMFRGRRCTRRCLNSIRILRRQRASAKLESCLCDGTEPYECRRIKDNMDRLCFGADEDGGGEMGNEVEEDAGRRKSGAGNARSPAFILLLLPFSASLGASRISR